MRLENNTKTVASEMQKRKSKKINKNMSQQTIEAPPPSFVDLTDGSDYMRALRPVVYDHEDERFVNNANESRRFALHVRCKDVTIETVSLGSSHGVVLAQLPLQYFTPFLQVEEKLVDIINTTPHFSERDEDDDFSVLTSKSFVRMHSNGTAIIRLDIDSDSDNRSYFFEKASTEEEPPEITYDKLKKGMVLDAILQILVDVDEARREVIFTAVVEEAGVTIPEARASKPKRKPTILHGRR
jgi:hypothetical protein